MSYATDTRGWTAKIKEVIAIGAKETTVFDLLDLDKEIIEIYQEESKWLVVI